MVQQFGTSAQNIKKRYAVLVFIKGSAAPLVLYVKDAQAFYQELVEKMKVQNPILIEKETEGPVKKVCFNTQQISAVAIQEEQYM